MLTIKYNGTYDDLEKELECIKYNKHSIDYILNFFYGNTKILSENKYIKYKDIIIENTSDVPNKTYILTNNLDTRISNENDWVLLLIIVISCFFIILALLGFYFNGSKKVSDFYNIFIETY